MYSREGIQPRLINQFLQKSNYGESIWEVRLIDKDHNVED